jgi:hypothetical protein
MERRGGEVIATSIDINRPISLSQQLKYIPYEEMMEV